MSLRAFESWALDTAPPAGWTGYGSVPTVLLTGGRFSDGCLDFDPGFYSTPVGLRRAFDAQRTWFVGFPIYVENLSLTWAFMGLLSGSSAFQVSLRLNTSGHFEVLRGDTATGAVIATGTFPISPGSWYFVELGTYIDSSAGTVSLLINGIADINATGVNTQALGGNTADTVLLGGPQSGGTHPKLGTAYICDDQGTSENTFLGDCRVIAQIPTGDGAHADWTPLTGSDQFAMVNEIPPDGDASYVSSQTIGALDTFTFPALGITGTVIAVKACMDAEKDDVGARVIAPVIRQLGTDYIYTDVNLSAGLVRRSSSRSSRRGPRTATRGRSAT